MSVGAILVTGAAGFVGWHACRAFLDAGWAVFGVDNFDPFYPRSVKEAGLAVLRADPRFRFAEVDVRDRERLRPLLTDVDVVLHLAARPGVRQSLQAPEVYREINDAGTEALLETCRAVRIRRFVFASSSSVYGRGAALPFSEQAALGDPTSPYAASKQACEIHVRRFVGDIEARAAIVRLFSVYGPRQRPDLALHAFARRLRAGRPVQLLGDGSSQRDYTHTSDVARGILAAVGWTADREPACEVFNLGSGRPLRLDCLVSELARQFRVAARWEARPAHPADLPVTWADTSKARVVLGFEARMPVHDGIADFASWYEREHGRQPCPAA